MNKAPLVSITIPCYNYANYVAEAINSVLEQSYDDLELIVVDNGSTDNSLEVIRSFSDPRLKVLTIEKNDGILPAWRLGFESSRGAWLALLPADDFYIKDKIEKQVRFLSEHPEIDVLGTQITAVKADGAPYEDHDVDFGAPTNDPWDVTDLTNWEWRHRLWMPSVLYHRKFCDEVANLAQSQRNVLDWEFHVRLMHRRAKIAVLPERLTRYRWHGKNQSDPQHTHFPFIVTEWVYSYARAWVPMLKDFGLSEARARGITKFIKVLYLRDYPFDVCAKWMTALLYPEEILRACPTFEEYRTLSLDAMKVACGPEMMGLVEAFYFLDTRHEGAIRNNPEMEGLRNEIKRIGEESERRAAERDRARQELEKKRAEVEKLRLRLAERERALPKSWFKRLLSK